MTILKGEDAQNLIDSLDNHCSNEEAKRRMDWASEQLKKMTRPNTFSTIDLSISNTLEKQVKRMQEKNRALAKYLSDIYKVNEDVFIGHISKFEEEYNK